MVEINDIETQIFTIRRFSDKLDILKARKEYEALCELISGLPDSKKKIKATQLINQYKDTIEKPDLSIPTNVVIVRNTLNIVCNKLISQLVLH